MQFNILGSLQIGSPEQPVQITAPKQRAVLAALLLANNTDVSTDQLIQHTWDHHPPTTAQTTLQSYIYRLRQLLRPLPNTTLHTNTDSYALHTDAEDIDLHHFRKLAEQARSDNHHGRHQHATEHLRLALKLWRGNALTGIPGTTTAQEATIINNERTAAYEELFDTEITLGNTRHIIPELTKLTTTHPYHETFRAQLILALYASGRQAEALQHYALIRRRLRDNLGIEPGPELQQLHRHILEHRPPTNIAVANARYDAAVA
ncbi:BTAD domain-containing putative transcriptional regulator [Dactylosporangium sp. NPDC051541]|uniref:AfsR/SARP family transcriptional regulator n=1 Tax=Dactylosporangium sp. NPDC051541 TaxID=3363977 RepID=UPI003791794D